MPRVTKQDILSGLMEVGIEPGTGLMVHSSLRSFGYVVGGARSVVEALMEAVTPSGTLMMPAFCHLRPYKSGGCGYFDPLRTPSASGAITEAFRLTAGVLRSIQPTHSFVAWGARAEPYTRWHHRTLTLGPQSPLGQLHRDGGRVLLMGVDYRANTFHHVVEMCTAAPCLGRRTESYPILLGDGRWVRGRTWGWRESLCPLNDQALYAAAMAPFERRTRVGASEWISFDLADCWAVVSDLLRQGAAGRAPCRRCPVRPRRCQYTVASDWDDQAAQPLPQSQAWTY